MYLLLKEANYSTLSQLYLTLLKAQTLYLTVHTLYCIIVKLSEMYTSNIIIANSNGPGYYITMMKL